MLTMMAFEENGLLPISLSVDCQALGWVTTGTSLDLEMEMERLMAFTLNVMIHILTVVLQLLTMMVKQKCRFPTTLGLVKQVFCLIVI